MAEVLAGGFLPEVWIVDERACSGVASLAGRSRSSSEPARRISCLRPSWSWLCRLTLPLGGRTTPCHGRDARKAAVAPPSARAALEGDAVRRRGRATDRERRAVARPRRPGWPRRRTRRGWRR